MSADNAANRRKWSEVRRSKTPTPAETAASRHEWDGGYPYRACKRCKALDLGKPQPCRGWYFGEDGERIYVEATR